MAYEPAPGSTAARVVRHLRSLPTGKTATTGDLVAASGADAATVDASTGAALRDGLIWREKRDGLYVWGAGEAMPGAPTEEPSEESEPDQPSRCRTCLPEIAAAVGAELVETTGARIWAGPITNAEADPELDADPPMTATEVLSRQEPPAATPVCDSSTRRAYARLIEQAADDLSGQRIATQTPRFALWSDGTLSIQRGGVDVVRLSLEETGQLLDYIEGVRKAWKGLEVAGL